MSQNSENDDAILILLQKHDQELSVWEVTFLEDIYEKDSLSPKQQEKLDSIWRTVMEGK